MKKIILSAMALWTAIALNTTSAADKIVQVKVTADGEAPGYEAQNAMDGNPETMWHTPFGAADPTPPHTLDLDLSAEFEINGFAYLPRTGGGNGTIKEYAFFVSPSSKRFEQPVAAGVFTNSAGWNTIKFAQPVKGRYVRLRALSEMGGRPWSSVAELKISSPGVQFRTSGTATLAIPGRPGEPKTELEWQYVSLINSLRDRNRIAAVSNQTLRSQALILPGDRDPADVVARRTAALLENLKRSSAARQVAVWEEPLRALQAEVASVPVDSTEKRYELYERICGLRRDPS